MAGEAAMLDHAQTVLLGTEIVVAVAAAVAPSAADPRINHAQIADRHPDGIWPGLHDPPDDLVTRRTRQNHAAILNPHHLAAAQIVETVPEMEIGVADATMRHFQQYLGAHRLGRRQFDMLKRLARFDDGPGLHYLLPLTRDVP